MAKLTYADIEKQGLHLTKEEAIKLHPGIAHIAQRGSDEPTDVLDFDKPKETGQAGIGGVKQSTGFSPEPDAPKETAKQKKEREVQEKKDAAEAAENEKKRLQALKDAGLEERAVTKEDLEADPTLAENDVKEGDIHEFAIAV